MDLDTVLPAGPVTITPLKDGIARRGLGQAANARKVEAVQLAVTEGPWGVLTVQADGMPVMVSVHRDGWCLGALQGTADGNGMEGPIPTYKGQDVPLLLGEKQGTVRFVVTGPPRPAGRKRYRRIQVGDRVWTYGTTETMTNLSPRAKRMFGMIGMIGTDTQLRRGPDPSQGPVTISTVPPLQRVDERSRRDDMITLAEDARLDELILMLLLHYGTDQNKLDPLWLRTIDFFNDV